MQYLHPGYTGRIAKFKTMDWSLEQKRASRWNHRTFDPTVLVAEMIRKFGSTVVYEALRRPVFHNPLRKNNDSIDNCFTATELNDLRMQCVLEDDLELADKFRYLLVLKYGFSTEPSRHSK